MLAGLKRLSGATEAAQDDYSNGTGVYVVKFKAAPKVKIADIKKEVPNWKIAGVAAKITSEVAEKEGKCYAGELALANPPKGEDVLSQVKGKKGAFVLSGALSEDEKGKQTLTLSKVAAAK